MHYRIANITHITMAVRDIEEGEELTISYIDGTLSSKERQSRLNDWGFKCSCKLCSQSDEEKAASDKRLERIKLIEDDMEKMVAAGGAIDAELGGELVELYEKEGLTTYLGHAYTRAALLYSMVGDEQRTRAYAWKAERSMVREHGRDASDSKAMHNLAANPKKHWSWAIKKPPK